jgi:hypothetical protein
MSPVAGKSEPVFLYVVEEALSVSGRGCLLMPGMVPNQKVALRIGDPVRLLRPNGEVFDSVVHGMDAMHNRNEAAPEIRFYIVLPKDVKKEQIPRGSELFWLGPREEQGTQ